MSARNPHMPSLTMSERDWSRRVFEYSKLRGWLASHTLPSQTRAGRWHTAVQGDSGAPDWLLARDGIVLLPELKTHLGVVTPNQRDWLAALGDHGRLWRPGNWLDVVEALR